MSRELKPCPFCNGPAVNVAGEYVTCGSPTFLSCAGRSVRADVEDWNRRATPSQRLDAATVERCALADVAAERQRQTEKLGWTPEHDDAHDRDLALARAAACYALAGTGGNGPFWITPLQTPQQVWPYRWEWKPKDRRTNLVRAAALLIAEIERVDRALATEPHQHGGKGA